MMRSLFLFAFLLLAAVPGMALTATRMEELIQEKDSTAVVSGHRVRFLHHSQEVTLIYDVHADRMRLIVPLVQVGDLKEGEMEAMMDANFHTSLDVRYATSGGTVFAAYLHPLASLQEGQFLGAIDQVANAASTFGSSYSAGSWTFVGTVDSAKQSTSTVKATTTVVAHDLEATTSTEVAREMEAKPEN